ncbi:MAG: hypothetical protein A2049_09040 [Elusimicrobia bacterium GWA2_62_23]|nr:MAG: hypothetical protein A2049_09040 [Elusimicrobia bacterium GWA2_62_23]
MKKIMLAVFAATSLLAAANAQVNFDQGVNVNDFIGQAVVSDVQVPMALPGRTHTTRDCVRFTFGPEDSGALTRKVYMRSQEYVTECHTTVGPNNQPVQNCSERPGMTWYEYGQIKMAERALLPWEKESFDMCLQGPWLDLYVNAAGYRYTAKRSGGPGFTLFTLTSHEKTAMKADEDGLNYADFSYADGKYTFKVTDKWAKEYAGEKVAIKVELYKDNALFFDTFKGEKEFTFDTAEGYTMVFAEDELTKPEADPADGMRGSKKYFLKWGFKRVGTISKDNFVKKDKTPVITR